MKKAFLLLSCLFLSLTGMNEVANKPLFRSNHFKERAFKHAVYLASMGPRRVGSEKEMLAARYIRDQFEKIGLEARSEEFDFSLFAIRKATLTIADVEFAVEHLGFDPYENHLRQTGNAFFLSPEAKAEENFVKDKTIITCSPANFFMLMALGAKTVIYLQRGDFEKAEKLGSSAFILAIDGEFKQMRSANIIGILAAPVETEKEIFITAHFDSYGESPGANDNATGIGAIIELARIFFRQKTTLTANLKFIALAGEETGLLGSRMYIKRHQDQLNNSILVFNIDTVGGQGAICAESLGGVAKELSGRRINLFPDYLMDKGWEGPNGNWRIMDQGVLSTLMIANVPDWLKLAVESAGRSQKIEIHQSSGLFSDLRTFAQAGIPATGVAQKTGSKILHTQDDTNEKINKDQIEEAGRICHSVVLQAMALFSTKK
jgi:hypothetical protein